MKTRISSVIAFFLVLVLLLGGITSCTTYEEKETDTSSEKETTSATVSEKQSEDATESEIIIESNEAETTDIEETESPSLIEGEYAALIENANALKNGVQAGFTDASRDFFALKNQNMSFTYALKNEKSQLVSSLTNKNGAAYITDTMDVFVRMKDGSTYYASGSTSDTTANLYRIGMYYYEARFEEQDFMNSPELIEGDPFEGWGIDASASHNIEANDDGTYAIVDGADPYMVLKDLTFSSRSVNMLKIRIKAVNGTRGSGIVFFMAGGATHFSPEQSVSFAFNTDGEYQDIYLPLYKISSYNGSVTSLRIDIDGNDGDSFEIESITPARLDITQMTPQDLSLCRSFMVYSDKMHHDMQIAATATTKNIVEVGMLTVIDEDTVEKLIVKDASGLHENLKGVDWNTAEYVGFDIKGAGIFGYILPVHENAGKLTVTLLDGQYRVEQTRAPENGVIKPSEEGSENANDFHLSQRIYTDEKHSFDDFIKEAEIERNPIDQYIKINEVEGAESVFMGYDPIRGIYIIRMDGPAGFNNPYYLHPNRHYSTELLVRSPDDRDIYVMTLLNSGALECAVVLSEDNVLLPIPVEVCKNFSEKAGERNLFNIDDPDYSESFIPLTLKANEKYGLSIVNLYQNWGKYPLKQISSIQFYAPYYHLSTGVTETNCILPWYKTKTDITLNTLPDFRSMSAPLWEGQPQHNSAGAHSWLEYTDAEGNYSATENYADYIDSYGPTYADVTMHNLSDDGRIKATYTHMEMPQTDENRTYYEVRYEVLEDISIADFKRDFIFYSVTDNEPASTADYRQIGYLDENNECVTAESNLEADSVKEYVLGDLCPYFSMFDMPYDASPDGYANVACLIYSSEIVIGGQESDADFIIINSYNKVSLSLNLENVELKAGDSFTLNMILLPWGSQESDYTDGDVNVRQVRENTLLNPLSVTSETDMVMESVYVPKVRSTNGETATFTLRDGCNNIAVRAYGFKKLTVPTLYELIDGNWVKVELSSATTPDKSGYYHHYDGYMIHYDGDGTYSYSFVTDMENGKERTFRLDASNEINRLPDSGIVSAPDYLDVYYDPNEIKNLIDASNIYSPLFSNTVLSEDQSYVSLYANQTVESFFMIKPDADHASGQYIVVKYRIPETNTQRFNNFEFFFSTSSTNPVSGENIRYNNLKQDGQWHVAVIDASTFSHPTFSPNENGEYAIQYVRFDVINKPELAADNYIDLAFFGICDTLEEVCKLTSEEFDEIDYVTGNGELPLDTDTCTPIIKSYIDPSSGYKQTSLAYYSMIDTVDGVTVHATGNSAEGIFVVSDYTQTLPQSVTVGGWVIAEGGIDHLVWSADGGKTWNKITATLADANDAIVNHAQVRLSEALGKSFKFSDVTSSRTNVAFQSPKLTLDLSAHAGEPFDLIIAAVPSKEPDSLCLLTCIEGLTVSVFSYTSYFNGVEINGTAITDTNVVPEKLATDKPVKMDLSGVVIGGSADSCLKLGSGWAVTRGGWDCFECKITSADGKSSIIRISEGVDLAESSNTLATLRKQYPTYGNDLGKGGNLLSPVLIDLSGYEGNTVALEVYGISNFGMSYKIAELINVYVPGLDNVFNAYDFAAAYQNAPNSAYTAEVLSEDGVTFFRATATKDGNGRLTLNNGERAIEPFGKTFILVYRGKSTNSGQKFQTYINVAGKTDASGATVPAATKENTDEWKVVIFQTASTLDFSNGAGFVAIDLFFNNGLSGDYIDIALFASVADEAEAWATFEEKLGDKIKLPYRAYVNNASVNGTAYSDGAVFTGGNNGNNTPVIIDLANVSIAEDSDLAGCIKLGTSWAITRGGWDYYICNIVAESGKTKSVRFYEGADYPSSSSTLATLKKGFEATYGSDLAVGGNIVVPAFDLSGFEGERVTVELVGISNYGAAYTVAKVINAQLPGIAEYDKVENFVSFVDYTKESVRKTVDIKDGTEYGASFTVPSGELVKTVRVNLTNSNSLNACSVNVSVYSFTGSYATSVAGTPVCSKTYTEVIKCADIEAELSEGDYLVVVKYIFAEGGIASSVVTDNAWSANTLPNKYSKYNIVSYKNGTVSTTEAIFGGIIVETVGASAPEDDVIDATFSDTTAKVIVIAGQSNAAGVSMNSYLQSSVEAEDYSKYVNGFPNVKIFFTCGSGSAGINYYNVVEEFVEVKLGQGFVDRSFGPELALAEYLAENYPDEQFYIIKYAIGGTAMHKQWNALSADKRQCVDELESKIDKGLELLENAGLTPEILAFFWMQGEGDALTAKLTEPYYDYQKALMTELREKYSDYSSYGEIPFIDTEINDEGFWAASHMINDAKREIARESSRNYIIDPNYCGLTALYENDDLAHYDSTSMLLLGKLYAMKLDYIYELSSK